MDPFWGGGVWPPMWALFSENYAKMKELGPVGGHVPAHPPQICLCTSIVSQGHEVSHLMLNKRILAKLPVIVTKACYAVIISPFLQ